MGQPNVIIQIHVKFGATSYTNFLENPPDDIDEQEW
jgi:hypothetical protein